MYLLVKIIFFLGLANSFQAQGPRKRIVVSPYIIDWPEESDILENIACTGHGCMKRSDADGPFWANRGKKDPKYTQSNLHAEEPSWIYLSDDHFGYNEPFFVTRGRKRYEVLPKNPWVLKQFSQDKRTEAVSDPFFAARGKKNNNEF